MMFQTGALQRMQQSQYTAYLLDQDFLFSPTEFKMLKHQKSGGFFDCNQVRHNGYMKLVYLTQAYTPLTRMASTLDENTFLLVVKNLFHILIEMQENGFLSIKNLDATLDHVFIDPTTLAVKLIYLPLSSEKGYSTLVEHTLRSALISFVNDTPGLHTGYMCLLCEQIANSSLSLEMLYEKCAEERSPTLVSYPWRPVDPHVVQRITTPPVVSPTPEPIILQPTQPPLTCSLVNAPQTLQFRVTTPEFFLGKNPRQVDGAVPFNGTISRIHCKILYREGTYYLQDLDSTNGTFLNRVRLTPQQEYPLASQDVIQLSNSEFLLEM